jgi:hypothetical protein
MPAIQHQVPTAEVPLHNKRQTATASKKRQELRVQTATAANKKKIQSEVLRRVVAMMTKIARRGTRNLNMTAAVRHQTGPNANDSWRKKEQPGSYVKLSCLRRAKKTKTTSPTPMMQHHQK